MASYSDAELEELAETVRRMQKSTECTICLELFLSPTRTQCGHTFCQMCIKRILNEQGASCPLCKTSLSRRSISHDDIMERAMEFIRQLIAAIHDDTGIDIVTRKKNRLDAKESTEAKSYVNLQSANNSRKPLTENKANRIIGGKNATYYDMLRKSEKRSGTMDEAIKEGLNLGPDYWDTEDEHIDSVDENMKNKAIERRGERSPNERGKRDGITYLDRLQSADNATSAEDVDTTGKVNAWLSTADIEAALEKNQRPQIPSKVDDTNRKSNLREKTNQTIVEIDERSDSDASTIKLKEKEKNTSKRVDPTEISPGSKVNPEDRLATNTENVSNRKSDKGRATTSSPAFGEQNDEASDKNIPVSEISTDSYSKRTREKTSKTKKKDIHANASTSLEYNSESHIPAEANNDNNVTPPTKQDKQERSMVAKIPATKIPATSWSTVVQFGKEMRPKTRKRKSLNVSVESKSHASKSTTDIENRNDKDSHDNAGRSERVSAGSVASHRHAEEDVACSTSPQNSDTTSTGSPRGRLSLQNRGKNKVDGQRLGTGRKMSSEVEKVTSVMRNRDSVRNKLFDEDEKKKRTNLHDDNDDTENISINASTSRVSLSLRPRASSGLVRSSKGVGFYKLGKVAKYPRRVTKFLYLGRTRSKAMETIEKCEKNVQTSLTAAHIDAILQKDQLRSSKESNELNKLLKPMTSISPSATVTQKQPVKRFSTDDSPCKSIRTPASCIISSQKNLKPSEHVHTLLSSPERVPEAEKLSLVDDRSGAQADVLKSSSSSGTQPRLNDSSNFKRKRKVSYSSSSEDDEKVLRKVKSNSGRSSSQMMLHSQMDSPLIVTMDVARDSASMSSNVEDNDEKSRKAFKRILPQPDSSESTSELLEIRSINSVKSATAGKNNARHNRKTFSSESYPEFMEIGSASPLKSATTEKYKRRRSSEMSSSEEEAEEIPATRQKRSPLKDSGEDDIAVTEIWKKWCQDLPRRSNRDLIYNNASANTASSPTVQFVNKGAYPAKVHKINSDTYNVEEDVYYRKSRHDNPGLNDTTMKKTRVLSKVSERHDSDEATGHFCDDILDKVRQIQSQTAVNLSSPEEIRSDNDKLKPTFAATKNIGNAGASLSSTYSNLKLDTVESAKELREVDQSNKNIIADDYDGIMADFDSQLLIAADVRNKTVDSTEKPSDTAKNRSESSNEVHSSECGQTVIEVTPKKQDNRKTRDENNTVKTTPENKLKRPVHDSEISHVSATPNLTPFDITPIPRVGPIVSIITPSVSTDITKKSTFLTSAQTAEGPARQAINRNTKNFCPLNESTPKTTRIQPSAITHQLPPPSASPKKLHVICSQLMLLQVSNVVNFVQRFNGEWSNTFTSEVTHVIVKTHTENNAAFKTLKLLQGIAYKKWVVSFDWVVDSMAQQKLLDEEKYEVVDYDSLEPGPRRSRLREKGLFEGFTFLCMGPFNFMTAENYEDLLINTGAQVVNSMESLAAVKDRLKIIIFQQDTHDEEIIGWYNFTRAVPLFDYWLIECISQYKLVSFFYCLQELSPEDVLSLGFPRELVENTEEFDNTATNHSSISD